MDTPETISPALLDTLQKKQEAFFFKEALDLYIPPQMGRYVGDDEPRDAAQVIDDWLNNPDKQCLLLLGDSGSGKTLFGQWLTRQSFQYQGLQRRIPLFIPLLSQSSPNTNIIDSYLKDNCGIEDESERETLKQQPLLLILDGFDEMHQKINLYKTNKLWRFKDIKIIISCRSQALAQTHSYASLFCPYEDQDKPQNAQLQEYVMNPFTEKQIDAYLQQYVKMHQDKIKQIILTVNEYPSVMSINAEINAEEVERRGRVSRKNRAHRIEKPIPRTSESKQQKWLNWETYQSYIQEIPGLQSLLTSPFILSIAVEVLPLIETKHEDKENIEKRYLARINLYDHFVEQWFERQKNKLRKAGHISENYPIVELFQKCSKAIANAMLQAKVNSIELRPHVIVPLLGKQSFFGDAKSNLEADKADTYTQLKYFDEGIEIDGEKIKLSLILSGCPMMQLQKNQYAFLHKSLMEYFAARKLFEGVMVDASISLGYELNEKLLADEPETIGFLAERVEQDDKLKQRLFDVLEESKFDERVEVAAANAITILNYAKVSFSEKSLNRIRIKGADLSSAILDATDLRDADLRNVNLRSAWLNNAKLGGALMEEVKFGESFYLNAEDAVKCIAYYPTGDFLVSGNEKGDIQTWGVEGGHLLNTLKGHTQAITSLAFSCDGEVLASGSEDGTVRLWDFRAQKSIGIMGENLGPIRSLAFMPDSILLASGGDDRILRLWNCRNQSCVTILYGHTDPIRCVAFSPDGNFLVSGSEDHTLRFYELTDLTLHVIRDTKSIVSIAFSPDSKILASAGADYTVRLWDYINQKSLGETERHTKYVYSIAFSPDGKTLASGSYDDTIRLWDCELQKTMGIINGHTDAVNSVAFSVDGKTLASGSADGTVRFWDYTSQKFQQSTLRGHKTYINSIAFSPDGKILVSGSEDTTVRLWNCENQHSFGIINGHTHEVNSVAFSPSGKVLASGSTDNTVCLWDYMNQKSLGILRGHTDSVYSVDFSPEHNWLASGSWDKTVRIWDYESQKCLCTLEEHTDRVNSVAFHPHGKILASGSSDGTIRFWDCESQKCVGITSEESPAIMSLAISPDGKMLASGCLRYGGLLLWEYASKKRIGIMAGHTTTVISVAFSPDGKWLASGSWDRTVRIWDINTREFLNGVQLTSSITALAFKTINRKTYLSVVSRESIYYFEIKHIQSTLNLILLYRMGNDPSLMCEYLDLGGVVGLEQQQDCLLKQRDAIGNLSTKKTDAVLEARSQPMPYDYKKPPRNFFSSQYSITPNNAIVNIVRKKENKHVFLVIERIESNHYVITRADLFLDQRQKHSKGSILSSGQALIEICVKPLADMQELALQCVYKCSKITDHQVSALLSNLEADRTKRICYFNLGNNSLFNAKSHQETHNCLTWCEGHLSNIGIDVISQKSWLDVIAANPLRHLPDKKTSPNTIQNVSIVTQAERPPQQTNRLPLPPPERRERVQNNTSNSIKPSLRESDRKNEEPDSEEKCLMM